MASNLKSKLSTCGPQYLLCLGATATTEVLSCTQGGNNISAEGTAHLAAALKDNTSITTVSFFVLRKKILCSPKWRYSIIRRCSLEHIFLYPVMSLCNFVFLVEMTFTYV